MMSEPVFRDNAEKERYELQIGDAVAFCEYTINRAGTIYLTHVSVPAVLEGQGVGSALVECILEEIRVQDKKLVPLCPFVIAYLKRHPEWRDVVK